MMKTERVSPVNLTVGDEVLVFGVRMRVEHILIPTEGQHAENGPVAACISRLLDTDQKAIPTGLLETPEQMLHQGCREWPEKLPNGLYWNVQGNALASVLRILA